VPNKIFVGGVPITCTEEQFKNYFEPYGAISKVELHALRGFGYVTYESVEAVDACLEKYKEHYLCKKWVEVKRSIPRELIDSYEREQKRLTSELCEDGDQTPVVAASSPQHQSGPSRQQSSQSQGHVAPPQPSSPTKAKASAGTPTSKGGTPVNKGSGKGLSSAGPSASVPATGNAWGPRTRSISENATSAASPSDKMVSHIAQLKEMGFSEAVAKHVLSECVWDVNKAIDRLLAGDVIVEEALSAAAATSSQQDSAPADDRGSPEETRENSRVAKETSNAPWVQGSEVIEDVVDETPQLESQAKPDDDAKGTTASEKQIDETSSVVVQNEAVLEVKDSAKSLSTEPEVTPELQKPQPEETLNVDASTTPAAQARKRIERMNRAWSGDDPSQLTVKEDEFVVVWVDSMSENGWIHAEVKGASGDQLGWLPACHLKQMPDGHRWMRVKQTWVGMDESQCTVTEANVVDVWIQTKTPEGWVYAEAPQEDSSQLVGWVPVFCLEWDDA